MQCKVASDPRDLRSTKLVYMVGISFQNRHGNLRAIIDGSCGSAKPSSPRAARGGRQCARVRARIYWRPAVRRSAEDILEEDYPAPSDKVFAKHVRHCQLLLEAAFGG